MNFEEVGNDAVAEAKKNVEVLMGGFKIVDLDKSGQRNIDEMVMILEDKLSYLGRKFVDELQKSRKSMLTEFRNATALWEAEKDRMAREIAIKYESMYQEKMDNLKRTLAQSESQMFKTKEELQNIRQVVNNQEIFICMIRDQWNNSSQLAIGDAHDASGPSVALNVLNSLEIDVNDEKDNFASIELQREKDELATQLMARSDLIELLQGEIAALQKQLEDSKRQIQEQQDKFSHKLMELHKEQKVNEEAIAAKVEGFVTAYESYKSEVTREIELLTLLNSRQLITIRRLEEDRERLRFTVKNNGSANGMEHASDNLHSFSNIQSPSFPYLPQTVVHNDNLPSSPHSSRYKKNIQQKLDSTNNINFLDQQQPVDSDADTMTNRRLANEFVNYEVDSLGMNFMWKHSIPPPPSVTDCITKPIFRSIRNRSMTSNFASGSDVLFDPRSPQKLVCNSSIVNEPTREIANAIEVLRSNNQTNHSYTSHISSARGNSMTAEAQLLNNNISTNQVKLVRASRIKNPIIAPPTSPTTSDADHSMAPTGTNFSISAFNNDNIKSSLDHGIPLVLDFMNPITGKFVKSGYSLPKSITKLGSKTASNHYGS